MGDLRDKTSPFVALNGRRKAKVGDNVVLERVSNTGGLLGGGVEGLKPAREGIEEGCEVAETFDVRQMSEVDLPVLARCMSLGLVRREGSGRF